MRKLTAFAFFLFFSAQALAYPIDGWYWNPSESGRGLNIEMQDNIMFIALFHYDEDGRATWWMASGEYESWSGVFEGEFILASNGQCPGCPWTLPQYDYSTGGDFRLTFDSWGTATLQWRGGTTELQRLFWAWDLSKPETLLLGDFHFTTGTLGVYFGKRLRFDSERISDTSGDRFVGGYSIGGSANRLAVGSFIEDTSEFSILFDSSAPYYTLLVFDMSKDRIVGTSWIYDKGSRPSGSGLPVVAHRTASRKAAQSGVGPSLMSNPLLTVESDSLALEQDILAAALQDMLQRSSNKNPSTQIESGLRLSAHALETLDDLERTLESLRLRRELLE